MPGPLRVLQIANQPGPLRLFVLPVCRAMREAGADVELACMRFGANFQPLSEAGFPLHALSPGSWRNPLVWRRVYREVRTLLEQRAYDLMVVHTPVMSWIARYAARGIVPAVVYMAHGLAFTIMQGRLKHACLRWLEQWAGRYTDGLLVMNREDAAAARHRRLTRSGDLCFEVPGVGVDVDSWSTEPPADQQGQIDAELGLSPNLPVVLYLGRMMAAKRPGDILELARRSRGRAEFIMGGEGPLLRKIQRQAARVGPHVHVLGWTERIHALVHRCDVAVFPSVFREGLPRFLLEAQVAGKPVVAYDVRGSQDAVHAGQTGVLVAPADVEAFCQAVERLLQDEAARRKMGQSGSTWVRERFSLESSLRSQFSALSAVLRKKGLRPPWD